MGHAKLVEEFLRNRGLVLGFIGTLTRDLQVAEEIFQEVGLKVVEQAGRGTNVDRFLPWVREVARNAVADYYRKRPKGVSIGEVSESMAAVVCRAFEENEIPPEESLARWKHLADCMDRLSGRVREIVERRYRTCGTLEAIASAVGWSPGSVKVALSRARRTLFECVQAKLRSSEVS